MSVKSKLLNIAVCALLLLSIFALGACTQGNSTVTKTTTKTATVTNTTTTTNTVTTTISSTRKFTDLTGYEIELPVEITSVIHLWPASTAMQVFLGESESITGTLSGVQKGWGWLTSACPHLLDITGFAGNASAETLLALDPDVVITSSADTAVSLRAAGVPCVCMLGPQESVPALEEFCVKMGELLGGDAPAKATAYCDYLDEMVEKVQTATSAIPESERISLYYNSAQHGDSPLLTCGADYITQTWMDICGVNNIAVDLVTGGDVEISMEEIIAADPDYILVGGSSQAAALATINSDASWLNLTAVKEGRVIANPQGVMKWEKFGPEFLIEIVWFTQQVYPDLLTDIDIEDFVRDFYSEWYNYDMTDAQYQDMMTGTSGPTN